jgi:hypothetical protein
MNAENAVDLVWAVVLLGLVAGVVLALFQKRRGGHGPGPGAYGAVYDLLNEDKRNAIELIVEDRAASRDPEDADGNLPDLERPVRRKR